MSRISVKLGGLEIDYEGEQKFITDGLLSFAKEFVAAAGENVVAASKVGLKADRKGAVALSTSSMAQKLGSKTGPDLAVAAAAHLILELHPVPKTPSLVFYGTGGASWREGSLRESSSLRLCG